MYVGAHILLLYAYQLTPGGSPLLDHVAQFWGLFRMSGIEWSQWAHNCQAGALLACFSLVSWHPKTLKTQNPKILKPYKPKNLTYFLVPTSTHLSLPPHPPPPM